ncbi:MAG: Mercuric transport protein MerT [Planctomycetota bacterium]|nr:MAG: Mercuric transport protein MerT [Planctomycetota bacterium]
MTDCPECGSNGKTVKPVTVEALVTGQHFIRGDWWFCDSPDCEVVYFSDDGGTFSKDELTVPVGVKETTGERPLCYCFGHSVASIKDELRTKGNSDALQDIRAKMKEPGCSCETMNPSGSCCLGSVGNGIEVAKSELPVNRMGTVTKVGTVLSAIMASSCCWLPLVLLAFGISGAGVAATLETYRPLFIVVTVAFLGTAFYLTYRPQKSDSCCAGERRPTGQRFSKAMLWLVTVLAGGFLFFPNYVDSIVGGHSSVSEGMDTTVFHIEGMSCEGCAAVLQSSLADVPGVKAVTVDFTTKQAIVATEACCPLPREAIKAKVEVTGFSVLPASPMLVPENEAK